MVLGSPSRPVPPLRRLFASRGDAGGGLGALGLGGRFFEEVWRGLVVFCSVVQFGQGSDLERRPPLPLFWPAGVTPLRPAARRLPAPLTHEPPRMTRKALSLAL